VRKDQTFAGKKVTVAGLGRFGGQIAAARWLCAQGARVVVTDLDPAEKLADSLEQLKDLPIEYRLAGHRLEDFTEADVVVASPAIPLQNKFLSAARAAGKIITAEIRLFIERCPAQIIGVTGTKGKSTTTAMLGKMLQTVGTTRVGGNIGKSLLAELENIRPGDFVVLELSSYMLEYLREMQWSPHVALVTMIASDHLAWHGSQEAYVDAKRNILRFQTADDFAVLNEDDPISAGLALETSGKTILYGLKNRKKFQLLVPGKHNQANAQGALAAAGIFGVDFTSAQAALARFAGLPHRLERVHENDGVLFYNDSIATIPDAAVAALESFPAKKVIQIVGGYGKEMPITALGAALNARAKAVLCIGETGPAIADWMEASQNQGAVPTYRCGDLATAMTVAREIATAGDIVLLSPGFKSYDQFVNFEKRGEMFTELARVK
jgi:UDP-N-acetylmuramoylalanine--D-glutamate ligase